MNLVPGDEYYRITADAYNNYSGEIDMSQFFDGGDGWWYIRIEDYDDEEDLNLEGIKVEYYAYIKSTENVGGTGN